MSAKFKIGKRLIGDKYPPVVIAELGINHNGSLDLAIAIAESAIKSGAEIIKHQTHVVEDEMIPFAKNTTLSDFEAFYIYKKLTKNR